MQQCCLQPMKVQAPRQHHHEVVTLHCCPPSQHSLTHHQQCSKILIRTSSTGERYTADDESHNGRSSATIWRLFHNMASKQNVCSYLFPSGFSTFPAFVHLSLPCVEPSLIPSSYCQPRLSAQPCLSPPLCLSFLPFLGCLCRTSSLLPFSPTPQPVFLPMVSRLFWKYSEYPCSLQVPKL